MSKSTNYHPWKWRNIIRKCVSGERTTITMLLNRQTHTYALSTIRQNELDKPIKENYQITNKCWLSFSCRHIKADRQIRKRIVYALLQVSHFFFHILCVPQCYSTNIHKAHRTNAETLWWTLKRGQILWFSSFNQVDAAFWLFFEPVLPYLSHSLHCILVGD